MVVSLLSEGLAVNSPRGNSHQLIEHYEFESKLEAIAEDLDGMTDTRLIQIDEQC